MSELDDAIALLEQAVARLETAAAGLDRPPEAALAPDAAGLDMAGLAAEDARRRALTAAIVARVDAALGKIGQALEGGG
jgi:hypothetical protein